MTAARRGLAVGAPRSRGGRGHGAQGRLAPSASPRGPAWHALGLVALAWLGSACAGAPGVSVEGNGSARQPLIGGAPDTGDLAVVAIVDRRTSCSSTEVALRCTGTLIAPRVVLTAAHCLEVLGPEGAYEVAFGADVRTSVLSWGVVVATRTHPAYDPATHASDLALLLLAEPAVSDPSSGAAIAPVPVASTLGSLAVGQQVRVVGFGETQSDEVGTKRSGTMVVTAIDAGAIVTEPADAMSCSGDSGGPVLATIDGRETLVAVTASGDPGCGSYAQNVRIDAALEDFVVPARAALESLPAGYGGLLGAGELCRAGCGSSEDCPAGFLCTAAGGPGRCVLPGLGEGAFGASCDDDASCDYLCARLTPGECRCFTPCAGEPGAPAHGCAATLPGGAAAALVTLALGLRRRNWV